MRVTPDMIAVLRDKYLEIKRLRVEDQACAARGLAHDPKVAMAALARRFPGALRELDELPMASIDARLAELEAALVAHAVPEWAALQVAYHGTYRLALRIKRRSARKGPLDDAALDRAIAELCALAAGRAAAEAPDEPALAELDLADLRAILRPAGGRLHPWVLGYVARAAGVSPLRVAEALFLRERCA